MAAPITTRHAATLRRRAEAIAAATAIRDQAIRKARDEGCPVPAIAEAVGLTRGRVYQILSSGNSYAPDGLTQAASRA